MEFPQREPFAIKASVSMVVEIEADLIRKNLCFLRSDLENRQDHHLKNLSRG